MVYEMSLFSNSDERFALRKTLHRLLQKGEEETASAARDHG
jgi:hypothetical protein